MSCSISAPSFSRFFFLDAAYPKTPRKRLADGVRMYALRAEHDQHMKEEIGGLMYKMISIIFGGGFAKFIRFFKHLAGNGRMTAGIEARDVTFRGRIFDPIQNDLIEFVYDIFHNIKDKQKPEKRALLCSLPQKFKIQNRLIVFQLGTCRMSRNRFNKP